MSELKRFFSHEDGATMIEYGLIAGFIAIVIIVALTGAGNQIKALFETVGDSIAGAFA